MSAPPEISLCIPCYNAGATIRTVVEASLRQTLPPREILIVDDASTDDTLLKVEGLPVRIIRHKRNLGLACARNTALAEAKCEFVASLDSDCVPTEDWLQNLAACMRGPRLALAGGCLVESFQSRIADRWRTNHLSQHFGGTPLKHPPFIFGSNNLIRKSAALKAGGYNPRYRSNYEDVDMSARLCGLGYLLFYQPYAKAFHLKQDTVASLLRTAWRWNNASLYGNTSWEATWQFITADRIPTLRQCLRKDWEKRETRLCALSILVFTVLIAWDLRLWVTSPAHSLPEIETATA